MEKPPSTSPTAAGTKTVRGASPEMTHQALLYRGVSEFVTGVKAFVEDGQVEAEPVMIALPAAKLDLVNRFLTSTAGVQFLDMCELGRNPARIIPAVAEFAAEQEGGPARFVSESDWPGRSSTERDEIINHESLFGDALVGYPVRLLCLYDLDLAPDRLIAAAFRNHPEVIVKGAVSPADAFSGWIGNYPEGVPDLTATPGDALIADLAFTELPDIREITHALAEQAGFDPERVYDILIAVNEVASNSIIHGGGSGVLNLWRDPSGSLVAEIRDIGHIQDPLVGRYAPGPDLEARGLWLVNQLSDLVQIRSDRSGTVVRTSFLP
jgi:anti-sigma regulatory factor (Ser/Thr protein kinase)